MNLAAPASVLLSTTNARVLAVLAGTNRGISGRQVAHLAAMSHGTVWRSLRRFVEHGLVIEEEAGGRTLLYRLNRDHMAADAVIALSRLRLTLIERIRHSIQQWDVPPTHAWLFGSMARGEGDTGSDVDILLIRPSGIGDESSTWNDQVEELSEAIQRWSGNVASINDIREEETPRLREERPVVVDDLLDDAITLAGASAMSVFGGRT